MSRAQLCGWAAFVTFCYNTDEAALAMLLARPRCSSARLPETCTSNTDSLREDIPMAQETPYRKLPQQARGQQRIARLLDAAECVFAAVGYDAATTNAIAAQANTSIGSLYQFFPNKEALLTALAGRYLAELRGTLDPTLTPETTELPLPTSSVGFLARWEASLANIPAFARCSSRRATLVTPKRGWQTQPMNCARRSSCGLTSCLRYGRPGL